jgi:hypothetical protein
MKKRLLATCAGIALGAVLAGNALASGYSEWAQLKSSVVGGNYVNYTIIPPSRIGTRLATAHPYTNPSTPILVSMYMYD